MWAIYPVVLTLSRISSTKVCIPDLFEEKNIYYCLLQASGHWIMRGDGKISLEITYIREFAITFGPICYPLKICHVNMNEV
jgi:hypothetical protein